MFYYWSSYIKKHLLIDILPNFLPRLFAKLNGMICIELICIVSPKNYCKSTYRHPNLINDISNKTYRSTESK